MATDSPKPGETSSRYEGAGWTRTLSDELVNTQTGEKATFGGAPLTVGEDGKLKS